MPSNDSFKLGLGSWDFRDRTTCIETVKTALDVGYRHLDTAQFYGTEEWVGEGLRQSSVPREDVLVATKVKPSNLRYDDVIASTRASCDRLGLDTIDLLYIHWPLGKYDPEESLAAFNTLYERGTIRHVGLSNFTPSMLDEAFEYLEPPLFAHQAEMHPLLKQPELVAHASEHDYWFVAYSPLIRGEIFDIPTIVEIANAHEASPAQIAIAWLLSHPNVATVPKATGEHARENWAARLIELEPNEIERINEIDRETRVVDQANVRITDEPLPWNR